MRSRALLDKNFWTENGGAEGWANVLAAPEDVLDTRLLRRCTYAGQPFGEEYYVALFEEQFQRVWKKWDFDVSSHSMANPIGRANLP